MGFRRALVWQADEKAELFPANGGSYHQAVALIGGGALGCGCPYGNLLLLSGTLGLTVPAGGSVGDATVFGVTTSGDGCRTVDNFTGCPTDRDVPDVGLVASGDTLFGNTMAGGISDDAETSSSCTLLLVSTTATTTMELTLMTVCYSSDTPSTALPAPARALAVARSSALHCRSHRDNWQSVNSAPT